MANLCFKIKCIRFNIIESIVSIKRSQFYFFLLEKEFRHRNCVIGTNSLIHTERL